MAKSYSLTEFDQTFPDTSVTATPIVPAARQAQAGDTYGAFFPATGDETPLQAGLKATGNVPSSMFNLVKGVGSAILNPIDTSKGIFNAVRGGGAKIQNALGGAVDKTFGTSGFGRAPEGTTDTFDALAGVYKDRYGSVGNAQQTAINDPFGVGLDALSVISGGAAATGQTARLSNTISKVGGAATRPVASGLSNVASKLGGAAKFTTSQATGLSPSTIETITKNPRAFGLVQKEGTTRIDLADNVAGAVQKASDELGDLGQVYDEIRSSGAATSLPDNWLANSLTNYGLEYKNGAVTANRSSKTRNATDLNKIQEFINNWGDATTLTADEYLNMRHDLAELAKYDASGKSGVAQQFARDVREGVLNADDVRTQIPGLKELDAQYAEDISFYNKIKKDLLNKDGTFKDGAASKIINSVNASNPERLARLEKLYPGFTDQAKLIKAVEDVENAYGLKVGAYMRAGIGTGAALTGNIPVVIGAILAQPEIAVPLLKGYGYTAEQIAPILKAVREFGSDINNFRVPGAVQSYLEEKYPDGVPAGLSTKATITPDQKRRIAEELEAYDTTPMTVRQNGRQMIDDSGFEIDAQIEELKQRNASGTFTDADAIEARRLLEQRGITFDEVTNPLAGAKDYLYHGTNEAVLESIRKEGLRPGRRGQLSLSTDMDYAKSFALPGKTSGGETKPVLVRVKRNFVQGKTTTERLDGKPRPLSDQTFELLTGETIPPDALEMWVDQEWVPLSDA